MLLDCGNFKSEKEVNFSDERRTYYASAKYHDEER